MTSARTRLGQLWRRLELRRLRRSSRFSEISTNILGAPLTLADGLSFYHSYKEIFEERIYEFASSSDRPRIIDGGANVGLSVIFYSIRYPGSDITAFEADPKIFEILKKNTESFNCRNVTLLNKALWNKEGKLKFAVEGADAGRLELVDKEARQQTYVDTVRLAPYLKDGHIDFLKLDIEGAEYEVLCDCAELLRNVENIFVEYHSFEDKPQKLDEILKILRKAGFRIQIHTQFCSEQPLLKRKSQYQMDLQLNLFGVRV